MPDTFYMRIDSEANLTSSCFAHIAVGASSLLATVVLLIEALPILTGIR